jgi:hypothetical protein
MKTNNDPLTLASHENIRAMSELADEARGLDDYLLADAADMACMALLAVRDAVKRKGEPWGRWSMMEKKCGEHLKRVLLP